MCLISSRHRQRHKSNRQPTHNRHISPKHQVQPPITLLTNQFPPQQPKLHTNLPLRTQRFLSIHPRHKAAPKRRPKSTATQFTNQQRRHERKRSPIIPHIKYAKTLDLDPPTMRQPQTTPAYNPTPPTPVSKSQHQPQSNSQHNQQPSFPGPVPNTTNQSNSSSDDDAQSNPEA